MGDNFWDSLDLLTILNFGINMENYRLNKERYLSTLKEMTENQDKMLAEIIAQNNILVKQNQEIIDLLKENKK